MRSKAIDDLEMMRGCNVQPNAVSLLKSKSLRKGEGWGRGGMERSRRSKEEVRVQALWEIAGHSCVVSRIALTGLCSVEPAIAQFHLLPVLPGTA